jgi:hypothetical protein
MDDEKRVGRVMITYLAPITVSAEPVEARPADKRPSTGSGLRCFVIGGLA